MDQSQILGTLSLLLSVGGIIVATLNHKRVRSKCCGRNLEASIDIENTTPQGNQMVPRLAPIPEEKSDSKVAPLP